MNIKPNEWIRPGQITIRPKQAPKIDKDVSEIVGKPIRVNDPRLVKLCAKHAANKDPDKPLKLLERKEFREELKKTFKNG